MDCNACTNTFLLVTGGIRGVSPRLDIGLIRNYMGFGGQGIGLYRSTTAFNLPVAPASFPNGLLSFLPWYVRLLR